MATIQLTSETFNQVIDANSIVFIEFWSDDAKPSRTFTPIFEAASEDHPDIVFGRVDIRTQAGLAEEYGIQAVPVLLAFKEQIGVFQQGGIFPPAILEQLISQIREVSIEAVQAKIAQQEALAEAAFAEGDDEDDE